jgi:hypothetical protein
MPNAGDPIKDTVRKNPTFFVRRMIGIGIDRWGKEAWSSARLVCAVRGQFL